MEEISNKTNVKTRFSLVKFENNNYLFPFILVTSLFFLWGFAHSLLDVLNKHFQEVLSISKAKSGLIQASVYGGYFLMAIPAGIIMKRYGYKRGIVFGLLLYTTGAFLFIPAVHVQQFWAFLTALFIIALGLTCLETAANPYSTVLGPPELSAQRLNLSQSFNGLGWISGPLAGSLLIFGSTGDSNKFGSLILPYTVIGITVLVVAVIFSITKLPEVNESVIEHTENTDDEERNATVAYKSIFHYRHFVIAIIAQFCYVAAQTGINSFFINYVSDIFSSVGKQSVIGEGIIKNIIHFFTVRNPGAPDAGTVHNIAAGIILSIFGMGLFMIGRFLGSLFMTWFRPQRLLAVYASCNVILTAIVIANLGIVSLISLCLIYFFMSIMFPTIFALGLKGMGGHTKRASSFLIMAIVGGAICPMVMGQIADVSTMAVGFVIPLVSFAFILYFSLFGYKVVLPARKQH